MTPLGKNFWLGVFWGFTFFVVALVGTIYFRQRTSDKPLINKSREIDLLKLQSIPPIATLSIYEYAGDWKLRTLADQKVALRDFKGKVVFLSIWATWCWPCVLEMPSIQRLHDSLKTVGVEFVLVSDEPMDTLRSYARRNQITVPIYHTAEKVPAIFPVVGFPTTFIVSRDGMVMLKHVGDAEWDNPWTIKFIQELLK
jgi:peroxiredoxin